MKLVNKVEIRMENFEKCHVLSDHDCPLGQLYDYSCALKSFLFQKIQESESLSPAEDKVEEPPRV